MKFVHIADLHLGKVINQYSLLDIQADLLNQLLDYMTVSRISLLVIAGDIYDRSIPSQEAVNVLDGFLDEAINHRGITILMISGNHDSADRLNFASSLLRKQGLYIETQVHEQMTPIKIDDVNFYLLPFFKPTLIRSMYDDMSISTYQEAFVAYFNHQHIDTRQKNVLITHQFVGKNSIQSESEVMLSVGGSEIIDASLFDDFDYVALGHLHAPQQVKRETVRYSGSLMPYSFDEVKQNKSIVIVDTNDFSLSFYQLKPVRDLKIYEGYYKDFLKEDLIEKKDDLLLIELKDKKIVPHAVDYLRNLYPHLLKLTYTTLLKDNKGVRETSVMESMNIYELYKQFYQYISDDEMDEESLKIIKETLEEGDYNENIES